MLLDSTKQVLLSGRVVLASSSPRRREIITNLGIEVECVASTYDENLDRSIYSNHGEYVQDLAQKKVQEVWDRLKNTATPPLLVIGADTVVTLDERIFGKPKNAENAVQTLSTLANRQHIVFTGMCLKSSEFEVTFHESTQVKVGDVSQEQIQAYVNTGEPLDKAGGYGIQGVGGCLIESITGDYYTVVGLPLYSLVKRLNELFAS